MHATILRNKNVTMIETALVEGYDLSSLRQSAQSEALSRPCIPPGTGLLGRRGGQGRGYRCQVDAEEKEEEVAEEEAVEEEKADKEKAEKEPEEADGEVMDC
jgi:hypothetical protein